MSLVPESSRLPARDDLDEFLDQELENPEFAAALEDAEERSRLLLELLAVRKRATLTQGYVADCMGTSQSAISELEQAGTDPRLSTVQRYARAVGARVTFSVAPMVAQWSGFASFTIQRGAEGSWKYFEEATMAAARAFDTPPSYSVIEVEAGDDKANIAA
jgi:transcriptional regulator with XRE-family HTH domain